MRLIGAFAELQADFAEICIADFGEAGLLLEALRHFR